MTNLQSKTSFLLEIDSSKTFSELVQEAKFDWVHHTMCEKNFPIKDNYTRKVTVELVRISRIVALKDSILEIEKENLQIASIQEILVLAAKYPEIQKELMVLAPSTVYNPLNQVEYIPSIFSNLSRRCLGSHRIGSIIEKNSHIAVIK